MNADREAASDVLVVAVRACVRRGRLFHLPDDNPVGDVDRETQQWLRSDDTQLALIANALKRAGKFKND